MYEFNVSSAFENYKVEIATHSMQDLDNYEAVIADSYFRNDPAFNGMKTVFVDVSEENKSLSTVATICSELRTFGIHRNSRVLALGGGMIQDVATLSASLYMRGIHWDFAPTTLTAMSDSCLGGKSSINVNDAKNLVGNIYPPARIAIDTRFVDTLDTEARISGLAEGVKIAFAKGPSEFESFIDNVAADQPRSGESLEDLIFLSLQAKKWFIEIDEFDKNERQLLNFGHTFGHAFEAASGFRIQHGTAVALGMIAACRHPQAKPSPSADALNAYATRLATAVRETISRALENTNWAIFEASLRSDKKNSRDELCLVLPGADGQLTKVWIPFSNGAIQSATDVMREALTEVIGGER